MAMLKCKMCGGDVELAGDKTFGTCEYCGCTMTFPKVDDDQRAAAFNRGNHFRRIGEFDKALAVYERMVQEDDTDAEAHWCCALCRFGIEYVEDPATMEWLPTCHRASFDSFLEDVDYLAAVKHSAGITQRQYQKDAAKIADVQRGILATSQNTEPYDVFICYKETDEQGNRTKDSTLAQEIYYQLTEQGRRVFFSRITLEDVAGTQYEPYIFAALNSAKVMIVVGTKPEHFAAVWVKNEWSRFLSLMKKDHNKLLLPCYRDMDPYDLPEQLSVLQSYDMAKIGFIQDLTRGIAKVLDAEKKPTTVVKETIVTGGGGNVAPLLKRAFMYLEDGEWGSADEYCEKVLDIDPECAEAYLGKLMAELQVCEREDLKNQRQPFDHHNLYHKAIRFGDAELQAELKGYNEYIVERNRETAYTDAVSAMNAAVTEQQYKTAAGEFEKLSNYKDAAQRVKECIAKAKESKQCAQYNQAIGLMQKKNSSSYERAAEIFQQITNYRDSDVLRRECLKQIEMSSLMVSNAQKSALIFNESIVAAPSVDYPMHASINSNGKVVVSCRDKYRSLMAQWENMLSISFGEFHSVGLCHDGTVCACGDNKYGQCNVRRWNYVVDVVAGGWHSVGLRDDGTVVATGINEKGECDVTAWRDIVQIAAGKRHTVGLKRDGTVVAVGLANNNRCLVRNWSSIVKVFAFNGYTVGITEDGMVECTEKKFDVSQWTDIVDIATGFDHILGLKSDGTVVMAGEGAKSVVSRWNDIISINTLNMHCVGLKVDGTVVAAGLNEDGQCNVENWKDIVGVSAGMFNTMGIKKDGTIISAGENNAQPYGELGKWKLFSNMDEYVQQHNKKRVLVEHFASLRQAQQQKQKIEAERRANQLCQHCGSTFKKVCLVPNV